MDTLLHSPTYRTHLAALLLLLLALPTTLLAQPEDFGTGLSMDDEAYLGTPMAPALMRGDYVDMPAQASLKAYAPYAGNQGRTGTCVGWSTAYAARTILAAMENGWTDRAYITEQAFSPSYIYNQLKPRHTDDSYCTFGAYIHHALDLMKTGGAAPLHDFPFECSRTITDTDRQVASDHTILSYARLFDTESSDKITPVKKSLAEGKPVVIGMYISTSFLNVGTSEVWDPDPNEEPDNAGHAMAVIGYDDNMYGGSFEIMNSWGQRWGDQGFVWIPYRHFPKYVKYAFEAYVPTPPQPDVMDLAGALTIQLDAGGTMEASYADGLYRVNRSYDSGTGFTPILTSNEPAYVYAFASDLTKKTTRLVPMDDQHSAYLAYPQSHVPLLGDEDAYVEMDDQVGTDYLAMLYSKKELDLGQIMRQMEQGSGDFMARLRRVMGDDLINSANITYGSNDLSFEARSGSGSVVPLVVAIPHGDPDAADTQAPRITLLEPEVEEGIGEARIEVTPGTTQLSVRGTVWDDTAVQSLTVDGAPVQFQGDGDFNMVLSGLDIGQVVLAATDAAGNEARLRLLLNRVVPDTLGPAITISEPRVVRGSLRGLTVKKRARRVTVRGRVEDPSGIRSVFVNDIAASIEPDGRFSVEVTVPESKQRLLVKATDGKGNVVQDWFQMLEDNETPADMAANPNFAEEAPAQDYAKVNVFYATDRKATGATEPSEFYNGERGVMAYGEVSVSIPKGHTVGKLESPSWLRLEFTQNPSKHIVLLEVNPEPIDRFFANMQQAIGASTRKEAVVFVHGYNVTFEEAARRTAQMAYDLGFDGAPIFYSWPSDGQLTRYPADEADAQWTMPHLKTFLEAVAQRSGAERVHLIAHSMGNRPLTAALVELANQYDEPLFHQVLLTAPDIDAAVFEEQIAPKIPGIARRVTLYASSKDRALQVSKEIHGYSRAGDSGEGLIVLPDIDTIDASTIDTSLLELGHSYYAEAEQMLRDMYAVMVEDRQPAQRSLIRQIKLLLEYWQIPVD